MSDETVWVPAQGAGSGGRGRYHTDQDCRHFDRMRNPMQKDLSALSDDIDQCRFCAGTADTGKSNDPFEMRNALIDADPDVVGGQS